MGLFGLDEETGRNGSVDELLCPAGRGDKKSRPYWTSKFAVVKLTKAAAREVDRREIRVNCVASGVIATPIVTAVKKKINISHAEDVV